MQLAASSSEHFHRPIKKRKLYHFTEMAGSTGKERRDHGTIQAQEELSESSREDESNQSKLEQSPEEIRTSSREELIECIKRGQRPTWVPKPGLRALRDEEEALQERRKAQLEDKQHTDNLKNKVHQTEPEVTTDEDQLSLTKPRSALHRGDFSELSLTTAANFCSQHGNYVGISSNSLASFGSSPPPWLSASPPHHHQQTVLTTQETSRVDAVNIRRRRAPSLGSSLSSSFVVRTPTSPLVNATTNPYLDRCHEDPQRSLPAEKYNRRQTMPPHAFQSIAMSPLTITPPNFSRPLPPMALRRESSLPHQTHQYRRSLSSVTYIPRPNPQTPPARPRRLSTASDLYSGRRSSMVGSFEESILRGRMSTPPSKPLDFVAQIGVMGKGECPSKLQCPAHVSVPFPAVFYNYPSAPGSRSLADDTPSPYVGTIDLERNLKPVHLDTKRRKSQSGDVLVTGSMPGVDCNSLDSDVFMNVGKQKHKTASQTSFSIGGAYRVPKQGQVQIIIKNPNKTAVKLFLVPYDLSGMEAGTQTFVRQRSFSSGTIVENALVDKTNNQVTLDPLENKMILRYLIHLKFCCPSKERFYLHDKIRVVFANRVPDGKEKLRNEVQLPDPKFSSYKPPAALQSNTSISSPTTPTNLSPSFGSPSRFFGDIDGLEASTPAQKESSSPSKFSQNTAIPFHFSTSTVRNRSSAPKEDSEVDHNDLKNFQFPVAHQTINEGPQVERTLSPVAGFIASSSPRVSPVPWSASSSTSTARSFSPAPMEAGDGLLSRQFRKLNGQTSRQSFVTQANVRREPVAQRGPDKVMEEMPTEGDIGLAKVDAPPPSNS